MCTVQCTHLATRLSRTTTATARTEHYRQWHAVCSAVDGRKDARNMLRNDWLPINHHLLHLVGLVFICLSKMHGHSNMKFSKRELRRHVFRWRYNIAMNPRGTGCECVCWTGMIHISVWWLVLVIMLINHRIPWKAGISWPAQWLPVYQEWFCFM